MSLLLVGSVAILSDEVDDVNKMEEEILTASLSSAKEEIIIHYFTDGI